MTQNRVELTLFNYFEKFYPVTQCLIFHSHIRKGDANAKLAISADILKFDNTSGDDQLPSGSKSCSKVFNNFAYKISGRTIANLIIVSKFSL
jgi:hypothetical protein